MDIVFKKITKENVDELRKLRVRQSQENFMEDDKEAWFDRLLIDYNFQNRGF